MILRMLISLQTRSTSDESIILSFSKILTATFSSVSRWVPTRTLPKVPFPRSLPNHNAVDNPIKCGLTEFVAANRGCSVRIDDQLDQVIGVFDSGAPIRLTQEREGVWALRLHLRPLLVGLLQTVDLLLVGICPRGFARLRRVGRLVRHLVRVVDDALLNRTCSSH
jgi:hypothetical protein